MPSRRRYREFPDLELDMDPQDDLNYERLAGRAGNWENYQKPRPFHHPGRFVAGVLLNLGCWLAAIWCIAMGVVYWRTDDKKWLMWALVALVAHIVFRIFRYTNGLRTHCPLCHGTPLHEKRCRKHRLANKFLFFDHRTSTVLSFLTRGHFSCMYCGTPFRLRRSK